MSIVAFSVKGLGHDPVKLTALRRKHGGALCLSAAQGLLRGGAFLEGQTNGCDPLEEVYPQGDIIRRRKEVQQAPIDSAGLLQRKGLQEPVCSHEAVFEG